MAVVAHVGQDGGETAPGGIPPQLVGRHGLAGRQVVLAQATVDEAERPVDVVRKLDLVQQLSRSFPALALGGADEFHREHDVLRGGEVEGLDLGADDYLAKPFDFPVLVARVRALARRSHPVAPPVLRVADLVVDTAKRRAARSGRPLALGPKEFGVLEILMGSEGRVVAAEELLERVWDEFADSFTNAVAITISRLRAKLGDPPLIETVSRSGYRIGA
jgi:hypothetical protein